MTNAPDKKLGGHASIYRGKKGGMRVQGILTAHGGKAFDTARERIALAFDRSVDGTSDADVIEYLARHWVETLLAQAEPQAEW